MRGRQTEKAVASYRIITRTPLPEMTRYCPGATSSCGPTAEILGTLLAAAAAAGERGGGPKGDSVIVSLCWLLTRFGFIYRKTGTKIVHDQALTTAFAARKLLVSSFARILPRVIVFRNFSLRGVP